MPILYTELYKNIYTAEHEQAVSSDATTSQSDKVQTLTKSIQNPHLFFF